MQILAFGTFINLFTGIGTAFVRGIGKPRFEIQYMAVSAVLIVALLPILIHSRGIVGAALAYSIAQTVGSIYFLYLANRLFDIRWSMFIRRVMIPVVLIFALIIPTYFLCNIIWLFGEDSRWTGLGIIGITFAFYSLINTVVFNLLKYKLFTGGERERISKLPMPGPLKSLWKRLWLPV